MTNEINAVLAQMRRCESGEGVLSGRIVGIWADTLQRVQQQPEPVSEAGCEEKVDRSVSWTDLRSGLAEWLQQIEAEINVETAAYVKLIERVESLSNTRAKIKAILDAKDAST